MLTLLCAGTEAVRKTFSRLKMKIPIKDFPKRQFGGERHVLGYQTDEVHDTDKNNLLEPYRSSGPTFSHCDEIRIWDYDCFCSHSRYQERFDAEEIGLMLKKLHDGIKGEPSEREKEIISLLFELEILKSEKHK